MGSHLCANRLAPERLGPEGAFSGDTPSPPAFDSKIFSRKDLDLNLDMQSVRFGISSAGLGPKECAHFWCRCICSFPHATARRCDRLQVRSPVVRDTTLGGVWPFFNYKRGVKGLPLVRQLRDRSLKDLPADFGCVLVWIKAGRHLLVRVNVVSEVPHRVTEFLDVFPDQAQIPGDVNEVIKGPFVKLLYFADLVFRTGSGLVELLCLCASDAQQYSLKCAAAEEDHCQWGFCWQAFPNLVDPLLHDSDHCRVQSQLIDGDVAEFPGHKFAFCGGLAR